MGIIRINSEERIHLWHEKGADFMKEMSPEYRNGCAFIDELFDSKQDILEADTESEERVAEKRYHELKGMVKEAKCETMLIAFRSGLNIHFHYHLIPEPCMLVWFEDTGQKRVIPNVKEECCLTAKDGVAIPNMRDFTEFHVHPGGWIASYYDLKELYFVLNGQDYSYTCGNGGFSSYGYLTDIFANTGFKTYTFSGKCLDYGLAAVDCSLSPVAMKVFTGKYQDDCNWKILFSIYRWCLGYFLPWYLGKSLGF